MSEAARSRRDDARYEPPMAGRDAGAPDPLAELARLVGQDDPFRNVFRQAAASPGGGDFRSLRDEPAAVEPLAAEAYGAADHHGFDVRNDEIPHAAARSIDGMPVPLGGYHGLDDAHGSLVAGHGSAPAHDDRYDAAGHVTDPGAGDDADGRRDHHVAPTSVLADIWARDEAGHSDAAPEIDHGMADQSVAATDGGSSAARRPLAVLAAVLLLTVGGLAATFLVKAPSGAGAVAMAVNRGAPTIMAATGPTKVKIEDGTATAPEDQDAALLNKNGTVSSGPVKIVSSEEQPADLGQLPRSDLADGARPLPPPSASPFPEPKKVKTFLVHPDGTMLSPDGLLQGQPATGAPPPPADALGAALPATPKTAVKGGTTPKSATPASPASIAALAADPVPTEPAPAPVAAPAAPSRSVRQPASPGVHMASAKPTEGAQSAPSSGGTFGLQLASSPVEAEADAVFAKLKKKFPTQLGALTATVHKAETGDKPVYRVRVGGMSQEEAKSLCAQLQGAGGSCYVVRSN